MNYLITLLAPIIWGSTYLVTTELLPPDRPLLAAVTRALPAGLILLALGRKLPIGIWWLRIIVLGILNIGAFFYLLFVAAYHLPGGLAALIMNTQAVLVLLLGVLLLQQQITKTQVLACLLSALGVGFIALKPGASLDATGLVAGLLGALSMALGIVFTKRWGRPESMNLLTFTGWQLTAGGLFLLPIWLLVEAPPPPLSLNNYLGFGYLSFFGALCAYAFWFRGIERLPALSVSFLSLASPLSAVILGVIFLDQHFSFSQSIGALLIVTAILMAQQRKK